MTRSHIFQGDFWTNLAHYSNEFVATWTISLFTLKQIIFRVEFANNVGSKFLTEVHKQCADCEDEPEKFLDYLSQKEGLLMLLNLHKHGNQVNIHDHFDRKNMFSVGAVRVRLQISLLISTVIRQKGESQNGCFKTCAYQGVRNLRFSENLPCFIFLKHPFWDSPFCLITDDMKKI